METLDDCRGVPVDRRRAERELSSHGWTWGTLREETGHEPEPDAAGRYDAADILIWLGY